MRLKNTTQRAVLFERRKVCTIKQWKTLGRTIESYSKVKKWNIKKQKHRILLNR